MISTRSVYLGLRIHTIHHVNPKVPPYRMRECYDEAPPGLWDRAVILGPMSTFQTLLTSMWDEERHRFISFPEYDWIMPSHGDDAPQMGSKQLYVGQHEE
jgi:fatty acid desaturase